MCELMTIAAAAFFTVLHAAGRRKGRASSAAFTAMLMFWGAALMWGVDCTANALDGEPFFDFSREDAVLGVIILAAGFAVFGLMATMEHLRNGRRRPACA